MQELNDRLERSLIMARYAYPAIFTPEKDGGYSVKFPDFESCYTCGDDIADSLIMAEDVLALVLCEYEESDKKIPLASKENSFVLSKGEFVNFVACDTLEYRKLCSDITIKNAAMI